VPDGHGRRPDVLLGYDGACDYVENGPLFGAIVGRVANRTAGARFELDGSTYRLSANEGPNNNHSGPHMWFHRLWQRVASPADTIAFELVSRRGDQGFPGSLHVSVRYRLTDDNRLEISYEALPSAPTLVNLTCHAYWNLNGHAAGTVLNHTLTLDADSYTPADEALIPTGEIAPVKGTDMDFREGRSFVSGLGTHYDTNFLVRDDGHHLRHAARLVGDRTGIAMDVLTNSPGMQVYTGGFLNEQGCKDGACYSAGDGVALETQFPPDAIHHKNFPQPVFTPEVPFRAKTVFAFSHDA
jgi:aldose 1-epimerase